MHEVKRDLVFSVGEVKHYLIYRNILNYTLFVIFILTILDYFLFSFIFKNLSDFILFGTFLAIIFYSIETYKLRVATGELVKGGEKNLRLANNPILRPALGKDNIAPGRFNLQITNIGKGLAQDITFTFLDYIKKYDTIEMKEQNLDEDGKSDFFQVNYTNTLKSETQKGIITYKNIFGDTITTEILFQFSHQKQASSLSWRYII